MALLGLTLLVSPSALAVQVTPSVPPPTTASTGVENAPSVPTAGAAGPGRPLGAALGAGVPGNPVPPTATGAAAAQSKPAPVEGVGKTCYMVIDKLKPGQVASDVLSQGCLPDLGQAVPPLLSGLSGLPLPGSSTPPTTGSTTAPSTTPSRFAAQSSGTAIPLIQFYAYSNFGGASYVVYGYSGPCDSTGYGISNNTTANNAVNGIRSYKVFNNCTDQELYNQTQYQGPRAEYFGTQLGYVGDTYSDNLLSVHLRSRCTSYAPSNYSVCDSTRAKYDDLGGTSSFLGAPTSNQITNADGVGTHNNFANTGAIYWSPATGANAVQGDLLTKYGQLGYESGSLGYPSYSQARLQDNVGIFTGFFKNSTYAAGTSASTNGGIAWSPATSAHQMVGQLYLKWINLNDVAGVLGYPTTDEVATSDNGGRQNTFFKNSTYAAGTTVQANGTAIWSAGTGAWEVHGPVRAKYMQMNDVRGCHGYPISDVRESSMGPVSTFKGPSTLPAPWNTYTPRPDTTTSVSVHTSSNNGFPAGTATSSCDNDGSIIVRPLGQDPPQRATKSPSTMPTPAKSDSYTSLGCDADALPGSVCSGSYLVNRGDYVLSFSDVQNGVATRRLSAIQQCAPSDPLDSSCTSVVQTVLKGSAAAAPAGFRRAGGSTTGGNLEAVGDQQALPAQQAPARAPAGWEMNGATPDMAGLGSCPSRCGQKILVFDAAKIPFVAQNIRDAATARSQFFLHRVGQPQINQNRQAACAGFVRRFPAGSCDEYPFASSQEGGAGAQIREVPLRENNCQGGIMSSQYRLMQINFGDSYLVEIFHQESIPPGPYAGVDIAKDQTACPPGDES